jgi:hypothetical protein
MVVAGRDRGEHAEADVLTAPGGRPLMQRGEHGDGRVQPGHRVGQCQRQVSGLALVQAGLPR